MAIRKKINFTPCLGTLNYSSESYVSTGSRKQYAIYANTQQIQPLFLLGAQGQYLLRANKSPIKINGLFHRDPFPYYTHYFFLATAHGLNLLMK